ncbi:DnaJ domain-containing protein, partial [Patescibacteria group bacterium]|nr:DnaJ domain-containing protein [Patescibacteria group bacterium]
MNKRDFYDVLGVEKKASAAELKAAYRKKALEWHPDRNKSPEAEAKFKEINEAYEVLSNADKRAAYDQYGHSAFSAQGGPASGWEQGGMGGQGGFQQGPFTYYYTSGGQQGQSFDFGDFSDPFEIFEQFFGGASPFGRQQRRVPRYGLSLSFMEAAKGVEKEVLISGKRKKLKIPAGVDEGSRINFGDFYITIDVKPDAVFKREGNDVLVDLAIPFTLAILGGEIEVPTIDGKLSLKVRPGTQPGTMVRLRGQGIPHLRGLGRGDEYVRLIVKLPEKLTADQKRILEEYR